MKAVLRYYTGTGNTSRVLGMIAEELEAASWAVDCRESGAAGPARDTPVGELLVLGHPALGFGAPVHFLRWIKGLPKAPGRPAAIISVVGALVQGDELIRGNSFRASIQIGRILRRKGYRIIEAEDFSLPSNWVQVNDPPGEEEVRRIFSEVDPDIRRVGRELALLRGTIRERGLAERIISAIVNFLFRNIGRRVFGKMYASDGNCTGCSLCARVCPHGCIAMKGRRPSWNFGCASCDRCVNLCPEKSIQFSITRAIIHSVVNTAFLVAAVLLALGPLSPRILGVRGGPAILLGIGEILLLYFAGSLLELGPMDALLYRLGRSESGSKLMAWGWTKGWRRYAAPGWKAKA